MKKLFLILIFVTVPIFSYADEATTTPSVATSTSIVATSTVTITIRSGSITAFSGAVDIATSTTPEVDITPTHSSTTVAVPADSLLATLTTLDANTADFNITDLGYFSSYNSFIINCIAVPSAHSTPDCYNWTYAVNGTFPQIGIDDTILHDGDIVFLFFGPPRQTIVSTSTVAIGESFKATAQQYDLSSGNYIPAIGLTLGVGTPNPDFSFTELATSTADSNGNAIFTLSATGTYQVGIKEDFYFPTVTLTITEPTLVLPIPTPATVVSGGGGGGGGISHSMFSITNALAFLTSKQNTDGSFNSPLLSDWTALAFAASDSGASKQSLRTYLLNNTPALSSITDYERHAMALMALGINPYTDTSVDVITPIVKSFDGTQIGNIHLDNDDIFAIIPLLRAGYNADDDIIQKTTEFILSAQRTDGSWDGSVDMTAASIQSLEPLLSLSGVIDSKTRAINYLKQKQKDSGGWDNTDSTSWAITANNAVAPRAPWTSVYGYYPADALASAQAIDGAARPSNEMTDTRVWSTAYAVVAASGKGWFSILQSFAKPVIATSDGGAVLDAVTSTTSAKTTPASTATSTPNAVPLATTTPTIATSTMISEIVIASTSTIPQATKPISKQKIKNVSESFVRVLPISNTPHLPSVANQTAAVSVSGGNFLGKLWQTITRFFTLMF